MPGFPGAAVEFADVRVRGQRPDDRVFPAAPADHKYSHAPGAYSLTRDSAGKQGGARTAGGGHPPRMAPAAGRPRIARRCPSSRRAR